MESNESFLTIDQTITEIAALRKRLDALEASQVAGQPLPSTALLSHSFVTRIFAVWGLNALGQLILLTGFVSVTVIVGFVANMIGALAALMLKGG
jgi:hypothetical protein